MRFLVLQPGDPRVDLDLQSLFGEQAGQQAHDIVVVAGGDLREELDHGHVGAEAGPDRAEFESDGAAADYHETRWHSVECDCVIRGNYGLAVKREKREFGRDRSGGENDVFGGNLRRRAR
jgi:hypothetical protein